VYYKKKTKFPKHCENSEHLLFANITNIK